MKGVEYIISSFISSIAEIIVTYPIDYTKTMIQNKSFTLENMKTPYKGVVTRFMGVLPMRLVYWSSIEYSKNIGVNPYIIPLIASSSQTLIDYPTEQIKVNIINGRPYTYLPESPMKAFMYNYIRNIIFTYGLFVGIDHLHNPYIGGLLGSIISHPFDCQKTYYQSNQCYKKDYKFYIRGIIPRSIISLLSMGIGWNVFKYVKDNINLSSFDK